MSAVVLYPNETGGIAVLSPSPDCGLTVKEIADKDVPIGRPYVLALRSDLPTDLTYFSAWTVDFSSPDGHGIGHDAFYASRTPTEIDNAPDNN